MFMSDGCWTRDMTSARRKGIPVWGCGIPPVHKREPGIHPPKREGDEGGALLVERGGEVRVRDRKRDESLSEVSELNKSHNYAIRHIKERSSMGKYKREE